MNNYLKNISICISKYTHTCIYTYYIPVRVFLIHIIINMLTFIT